MQNPRISLVIPAYNEEKFIGDCLRSAIDASEGGFLEIIVIDNASFDKTREIAESFTGVRVIRENDKGLTKARQRGFLEAKGDILAYIDADTLMPKGWVLRVIKEFKKNDNLACLSGPYQYFDVPKSHSFLIWLYWHTLALPTYLLIGYMAVGGNIAIKKEVVEKMGGFDTSIPFYGEDTNIARRASRFGKVKFDLNHVMRTSGRRLMKQGFVKTAYIYVINYLSEVFRKKPATDKYQDYR